MKVIFIQVFAPAHGLKTVPTILKRGFLLLMSCDCWLRDDVEKASDARLHNSVASLKTTVKVRFIPGAQGGQ